MWRLNGNGLRVMYFSIIVSTIIVILLSVIIWQNMDEERLTGVRYDNLVYLPQQSMPLCAGDVLTYEVTTFRNRIAPLDVIGSWCNVETAVCLADETLDYHISLFDIREPVTRTRSITIPTNARLTPGAWVYVHQVAPSNTDLWQTYLVPFIIAADCPTP